MFIREIILEYLVIQNYLAESVGSLGLKYFELTAERNLLLIEGAQRRIDNAIVSK